MTQTSTDELNDRFQQAASPAEGLAILEASPRAAVRALADLNHIESACCGGPTHSLMADRFGEDWATQVEPQAPTATPYYARTHSATKRHVINPDAPGGTLCGHYVSLPDEFIGDAGQLARPEAWMILDLPPCGKCTRSEAARGLVPPVREPLAVTR